MSIKYGFLRTLNELEITSGKASRVDGTSEVPVNVRRPVEDVGHDEEEQTIDAEQINVLFTF